MNPFYFLSKKTAHQKLSQLCISFCAILIGSAALQAQQCSPLSSLSCPSIVKSLPFSATFDGTQGGLKDKNGVAVDFTLVDRPSSPLTSPTNSTVPGFEPSKLEVSGGRLSITTTPGISYLNPAQSANTNSQVNALGTGFVAPAMFSLETTILNPNPGTGKSEQAGLWFGLDEDNFVKLVILSSGNGTSKFELRKEIAANSSNADSKTSAAFVLSNSVVSLKLVVDKAIGIIEGFYGIDGATEVSVGSLAIPPAFTNGKTLPDGVTTNITFAGIFATNRNSNTPVIYTFDDFTIKATPPGSYFNKIDWAIGTNLPYNVNEAQGRVVNNKLYSFGGFDSKKACCTPTKRAFVYDPVTQTWTAIADLPFTPNGTDFGGITHGGIATNGIDIFLAGGYTSNSSGTGQIFGTNQVWKYIVSQDAYVPLPNLPINISAGQLEYLDNKLHYMGGTNASRSSDLGTHYVLDLTNLQVGWTSLAPLQNPRHHAGSAVYGGKIYMIGGQHAHDASLATQKDVDVYDPATNAWKKLADLPVPAGATGRSHISSATFVKDDRLFVFAGEVKNANSTNFVSAYSPTADSWENLTPLPQGRYSGIATSLLGDLYYFGGSNSKTTYAGKPLYTAAKDCSPISRFDCPSIVKGLPLRLTFNGIEGGVVDKSSVATGFTMVDNPSSPLVTPSDPSIPGYEPSKLTASNGNLTINTTAGINYLNPSQTSRSNSQVNALGVGFRAPAVFNIETTLLQPGAGSGNSEQAGLWFGLDEDNFVKLVVISAGNGVSRLELRKEVGAMSGSADVATSGSFILSTSNVRLRLEVNGSTGSIEGFYRLNSGNEASMGKLTIPGSFISGKSLSDSTTANVTFAGIFATNRNSSSPLNFTFDDFKIEESTSPGTQCAPISTLTCPALVKNLPVSISFTGNEGGIPDKNGTGTGFTMVDRPSAPLVPPTNPLVPGFEASKLEISNNHLTVTTTSGISYLTPSQSQGTNSQVNSLGIGFTAPTMFNISTTLLQPDGGSGKSEQAGLWFGLDEDNFVKFVVMSAGFGKSKFEMRKEVAGNSGSSDVKTSGSMILNNSIVNLRLKVDKTSGTIEGVYSINGASEVSVGVVSIPQAFTSGKTLSDGVTGSVTFAGIFATNRSSSAPLTYSFDDFMVEELTLKTTLTQQPAGSSSIDKNSFGGNKPNDEKLQLKLYPNPVNQNKFKIMLPEAVEGVRKLEMIDATGKQYDLDYVISKNGEKVIDVHLSKLKLTRGVYLIRVQFKSPDTAKSVKLLIL